MLWERRDEMRATSSFGMPKKAAPPKAMTTHTHTKIRPSGNLYMISPKVTRRSLVLLPFHGRFQFDNGNFEVQRELLMIQSIVTHPGGAHKDDFLACAVLLSAFPVSIFRRDPTQDELADPQVAVVDVGHRHEPDLHNFDHHQFPRDMDPTCSLSLVLQNIGIYEDTKEFCSWLETAEWFDCRGPNDTADWLGVDREAMAKLNSPIDVSVLQAFAKKSEHHSGEPIWEVMKMIGADLVSYVTNLRDRMGQVAQVEQVWDLGEGDGMKAAFVPRTDPPIDDASGALAWRIKELELEEEVVAMVYPDSRGAGYGMRRFNDSPVLDFSLLADEPDVHFTHARGFIAKTSCPEIDRLKQLLLLARVG